MNSRLTTIALCCVAIILAIWAWRTATAREFYVVFGATGPDAKKWAEQAKKHRRIELVTMRWNPNARTEIMSGGRRLITPGEMGYAPVARNQIDDHIRFNSNVLVRRWLSPSYSAAMDGDLAEHGYPGLSVAAEAATRQRNKAIGLTIAAALTSLCAFVSQRCYRRFTRASP